MLFLYRKSEQKDLTADQRRALAKVVQQELKMNPKDFDELVESVREGGRILRGEVKPSREFSFTPEDVQAIRKKLKVSR
jgi:hypothetical protein